MEYIVAQNRIKFEPNTIYTSSFNSNNGGCMPFNRSPVTKMADTSYLIKVRSLSSPTPESNQQALEPKRTILPNFQESKACSSCDSSRESSETSFNTTVLSNFKWKLLSMIAFCLASNILSLLGLALVFKFSPSSQDLIQELGMGIKDSKLRILESDKQFVISGAKTLGEVGFLVSLIGLNLNLASFVVTLVISYFLIKIITLSHIQERSNAYLKYKRSTSTCSAYALCSLTLSIVFYLIAIIIHVLASFDLQTVIIACIIIGITVILVMLSILHTANAWYYSMNTQYAHHYNNRTFDHDTPDKNEPKTTTEEGKSRS